MLVVGLTGGIATGKSTVSNLLKSQQIPVIDADVLAREVVQPGTKGLTQIIAHFGSEVLFPDGTLDRKKLGTIIFNNEVKRKKLNSIVHPAVRRGILWNVFWCWLRGEKLCVVDVPLLIEGGLWKWMGKVIVVYCSADIQLQRLMTRDNSSREDASARLNSQLPITQKVEYADIVLDNSGTLQDLEQQVHLCLVKLEPTAGWSWKLSWLFPPFALVSMLWTLGWRFAKRSRQRSRRPFEGI
ncbi:dephospho-CoA kinase-domain-containing protein [Suillus subalutaceus]|uniref:dephospho-CoA kinase-domain-containing protein n=1 Tax=Suillus subalutaceus TaxID=48586 RepID=UPI001B86E2D3|nr:dephospho-CoA kinase-domain-containing protein [Suillus subalutaceus]KAG1837041.1 dephospho-CoA kinase-domain-containing protein [Suillus subalutaceus]